MSNAENHLGCGIIPPLVTPLLENGHVDDAGLTRLVEKIMAAGASGLFVLGTTGEGPLLSRKAQRQVVTTTIQAAARRCPVLVGVTDPCLDEVLDLSAYCAEAGAAAVVLAPPPYSPLGADELNRYLDQVVEAVTLPVFLYNIPSRTGGVSIASVRHAMGLSGCIGFKDSSADMNYLNEVLFLRDQTRPEFRVLVGPEELLGASVMMGADGGVAGGANLFPELFVTLFEAAKRGEAVEVRRLHRAVMSVSTTLYRSGRFGSSFIKSVKGALQIMGVCEGHMAAPFEAFTPDDQKRLEPVTADAVGLVREALSGD